MQQAVPQLGFGEAVQLAISRVKEMDGRSRRSEFWWTVLAVFICNIVLAFIPYVGTILSVCLMVAMIPLMIRRCHDAGSECRTLIYVAVACSAATTILGMIQGILADKALKHLDMSAANLHDTLRIPLILLGLVSLVVGIYLLIKFVQDSQPGTNQWGPSPKYPDGMPNQNFGPQQPPQMPNQNFGPQQPPQMPNQNFGPQQPPQMPQ